MVALERKFVVAQADITTERRLHGSGGQARSLYAELMQNLATRAKPEGGALSSVVERWVSDLDHEVRTAGGSDPDVVQAIEERLKPLQELVSGYDFAAVVTKYLQGFQSHDEALMAAALRWLRAEYHTKTEARHDLGVRSIIDDPSFYDYLKLFAAFVRLAGFAGLLVNIDEMGILSHRLNHAAGAERELRDDPAHRQRLPPGQRLGYRLPVRAAPIPSWRIAGAGWPATRLLPPDWRRTRSPATA